MHSGGHHYGLSPLKISLEFQSKVIQAPGSCMQPVAEKWQLCKKCTLCYLCPDAEFFTSNVLLQDPFIFCLKGDRSGTVTIPWC